MPPIEEQDDDRAMALVLWARTNRISISKVRVGSVEICINADLELAPSAPSLAVEETARSLYAEYAGPALRRLLDEQEREQRTGIVEIEDE